jgi:hypothetical protein
MNKSTHHPLKTLLLIVSVVLFLTGCANKPAPASWESNAQSSLQSAVTAYLAGNTKSFEQDFSRTLREISATGRADLLAKAELTRCAAELASLVLSTCAGYLPLAADAGAEQQAYAAYLANRWDDLPVNLLPNHHARAVSRATSADVVLTIEDPLSRLVAAGALLQHAALSASAADALASVAVQTASDQGWRRPLLAWLGFQLKIAETNNNVILANALQRRIDLILQSATTR